MSSEITIETDVLVIGGGIAGCFAAIKAKEKGVDVIMAEKAHVARSGGTAAATAGYMIFNPEWGHDLQACMDAVAKNGEYLNNREWTEIIMRDSLATYEDLLSWGVQFPAADGKVGEQYQPLDMADSSGMRTLFGQVFVRRGNFHVLDKQVSARGVKVMSRVMVTDLINRDGEVAGAIGFSLDDDNMYIFKAKATVVSTGTTSFKPPGSGLACLTGDGDAMAYRAGAEVTGKEFPTKFHTIAAYPHWRSYMGFVAYPHFTDAEGESISLRKVANVGFWDLAMDNAVHAGRGPVIWNLEAATDKDIEGIRKVVELSEGDDVTLTRTGAVKPGAKIPIAAGAGAGSSDSMTGGIWVVNTGCATSVPGLYAAGECCGTRYLGSVHTARGFGLTASAVTGARAGRAAADRALSMGGLPINQEVLTELKKTLHSPLQRKGGFTSAWVTQLLQNTMVPYFILHIKQEKRLQAALTIVEFLRDHLVPRLTAKDRHELRLVHETRSMVLNAEMILRASLFRTESRGQHYREDFPRREDPFWLAWVRLKDEGGEMKATRVAIPDAWWPDLAEPYEERYPRRFLNEPI